MNIDVIAQNAIKIKVNDGKIIYIDPFKLEDNMEQADYIFITHSHYDHFSPEDLAKVINPLEATGLSAGEASGVPDNPECKSVGPDMIESEVDNKIQHNPDETSCTLCSKAKDCLYRK